MAEGAKCVKCDREFNEEEAMEYPGKVHVHKGEVVCEDCLVDMGVEPSSAQPYKLYIETHSGPGFEGSRPD